MDINRLREFLVLSELLNYSKAANQLYITQPVLSRHIHDLEEDLGGQLFIRDTHRVSLTEFGTFCADQFRAVVKSYDSAMLNIRNESDTSSDPLTVGFLDYAVRPFLNRFVSWFEEAHPNIEVEYDSGTLDDLTEAVKSDEVDLAFVTYVGSEANTMDSFESELIYEDRLLAVFSPALAQSDKESITIEELSVQPLISFSKTKNPYTSDYHRKLFSDRGLNMNIVKNVSSLESGLFYAKTGIGAFIMPQHLSGMADELFTLPIINDDCTIPLHLVWKSENRKKSLETYVHDFKLFYRNRRIK